ncbi:carboxypeptidase-like regulatory domain-containing protein [Hymenobacter ruricola]|uniref:Carboxypeptidase-like regulatory domain-containing protein n=1 Tax=Hymenobacter ruricola TaxID=2791023 RepID=A0ABS0I874_9BACT|nr:carboxypeptidase-like regulatory domain-containing protein [Hymenobacter ruricola]MBF9223167.1 carboxypeptidase-like regulatory domain-containing protein [Hymenobacter ruricola]
MQTTTQSRIIAALAFLSLLLAASPSWAQLAYTDVLQPKATAADADPEVGKPAAKTTTKTIHGVIQNDKGALPGATVWLQGSRTIVVTNSEGEFELQVPADATTVKLVCGYGGLQEEVLTLTPAKAMGSIYLLQTKSAAK